MKLVIEVCYNDEDKNRASQLDLILAVAKSALLEVEESGQLLSPNGLQVSTISHPVEAISGVIRLEG